MSHEENRENKIHVHEDKSQHKSHKRGSAIVNNLHSRKLILKMNENSSHFNKVPTMSSNASTFIVKNPEKIIFVDPRIRKLREESKKNSSENSNN